MMELEELRELSEWLQSESDKELAFARGRRSSAAGSRTATAEDLQVAHRIAEQMAGHKLPKTSVAKARADAEIEERIADKQEQKALRLARWAKLVREKLAAGGKSAL